MRDDFCVFILTHGRPDRQATLSLLNRSGYTGKIFLVIDDEDATADRYREKYGDRVLQFDKAAAALTFDEADNFDDRRAIVYARNTCFTLARQVGVRYFVELDDDYHSFAHRYTGNGEPCYIKVGDMDAVFSALVDFLAATPALTVALSQGGDFIGGGPPVPSLRRKAMNSFVCDVERPFQFVGRINEDVNTYVRRGGLGDLFFTVMAAQLVQENTQQNRGGMTDIYLDGGTFRKSFYSVLYNPSCVRISTLGDHGQKEGQNRNARHRIHHRINWNAAVPVILREEHRKPRPPDPPAAPPPPPSSKPSV